MNEFQPESAVPPPPAPGHPLPGVAASGVVKVEPWPSEQPLAILLALVAAGVWLVLTISIIGLVYVLLIGLFLFVGHIAMIAHLRGNTVKLGPQQFPDLYRRVQELSRQVGLPATPDAYVAQEGGTLNAFATRFFSRSFIVLYSDLLEACGDNTEARDFVLAHELGHLKMGHLRWQTFLLAGAIVPFLWNAYSRAREYTCDRFGLAVARDRQAALRGLAILAAGGRLGATLRMDSFVQQRADLNRPLMKIGSWLSTHPPLCERVAALEPGLAYGQVLNASNARMGALAILGGVMVLPVVAMLVVIGAVAATAARQAAEKQATEAAAAAVEAEETAKVTRQVTADVAAIRSAIEAFKTANGRLPEEEELEAAWKVTFPNTELPSDPGWDEPYAYETNGVDYLLGASAPKASYLSVDGGRFGDYVELDLPSAPAGGAAGGNAAAGAPSGGGSATAAPSARP